MGTHLEFERNSPLESSQTLFLQPVQISELRIRERKSSAAKRTWAIFGFEVMG
jgi:hypothetical protein